LDGKQPLLDKHVETIDLKSPGRDHRESILSAGAKKPLQADQLQRQKSPGRVEHIDLKPATFKDQKSSKPSVVKTEPSLSGYKSPEKRIETLELKISPPTKEHRDPKAIKAKQAELSDGGYKSPEKRVTTLDLKVSPRRELKEPLSSGKKKPVEVKPVKPIDHVRVQISPPREKKESAPTSPTKSIQSRSATKMSPKIAVKQADLTPGQRPGSAKVQTPTRTPVKTPTKTPQKNGSATKINGRST
jgi:hypothetical protein